MTEIKPYLQRMVDRFANAGVQASLKGFSKNLQFTFTDTNESWLIRVIDGKEATLIQEKVEKPDILVTMTTDTLAGIMDKKINAVNAYMQGKIQVRGAMDDMMKMQTLMM